MSPVVASGVQSVTVIAAKENKSEPLQTDRRNGRISILGLWQPDKSFKYALASGSFKVRKLHRASLIGLQNWLLKLLEPPDG